MTTHRIATPTALLGMVLLSLASPAPTTAAGPPAKSTVQTKLDRLIIPELQLFDVTLSEAIEYLHLKSRDLDQTEPAPSARGITFHLSDDLAKSDTALSLELKRVPIGVALAYITEFAGTSFTIKNNAVLIPGLPGLANGLPCGVGEDWAPYKNRPPPKNPLQARISARIFPTVQFADASLEEAVEHFQLILNSICEDDRPESPIKILIKPGGKKSATLNVDLKHISAWDALQYVALLSDHEVRVDTHALVLVPKPNPKTQR